MIGHLRGNILVKQKDHLILDVAGVGYEVFMPAQHLEKMKEGEAVAFFIYTQVREDQLSLFGFLTLTDRQLFTKLISVSGIGPKLALMLLSELSSEALVQAVYGGDLVRLTQISGIGKKTAERLLLELKDKLSDLPAPKGTGSVALNRSKTEEDVLSALLNLGYSQAVLDKLFLSQKWSDQASFEEILKECLKALSTNPR